MRRQRCTHLVVRYIGLSLGSSPSKQYWGSTYRQIQTVLTVKMSLDVDLKGK